MNAQRPFRSIASTLIHRTLALALLCMALSFALQWWWLRQEHHQRFDELISEIADTGLPLLSIALWDIEPRAVQAQIDLLVHKRKEIGYAILHTNNGQIFEAGDPTLAKHSTTHTLVVNAPEGNQQLGQLIVVGNPAFLHESLMDAAVLILAGCGALTIAICLMIALLLRRMLYRPLSSIAQFADQLTPERLTQPLVVDRTMQRYRDEIDLLEQGFNTLQTGLRTHIDGLDALVQQRTQQLEQLLSEIRHLSMTDALTEVYNRRALEERLPGEIERARRYKRSLSLMFIDVDHFKQFNDTHGHTMGDEVLRIVAKTIAAHLRQNIDWTARYGGEEFVVVLPETKLDDAHTTATRLCEAIANTPLQHQNKHLRISASFGVTEYRDDEDMLTLLARTDALTYQAKANGRNRVESAP